MDDLLVPSGWKGWVVKAGGLAGLVDIIGGAGDGAGLTIGDWFTGDIMVYGLYTLATMKIFEMRGTLEVIKVAEILVSTKIGLLLIIRHLK